jgi:hypothetical protein
MAGRGTTRRPPEAGKPTGPAKQSFPRRDANGRVISVSEMIIAVVAWVAAVTVVIIGVDGIASAAGRSAFGHISGWPAAILAVWLFIEDFRAWRIGPARFGVALVAAALGALGGTVLVSVLDSVPPLFAGALGALLACLIYATVWFYGIRLMADRTTGR